MAKTIVTQPPKGLDFGPGASRVQLCLQATYQIEPMLLVLANAAMDQPEGLEFLVQSMVLRLSDLNDMMVGALDDKDATEADLEKALYGRRASVTVSKEVTA